MRTGVIETLGNADETKRPRVVGASGGASGGGNGEGPGGGYANFDDNEAVAVPIDKSKYIAWFLLLAVGMTFAGLLGAYLMIATTKAAEWRPFELPVQIWFSTVLILFSSITYSLARAAIDRESGTTTRRWLIATTVLGAAFISSQLIVWMALVNRGFYLAGNPYAGFFYILTAAHLVHVLGGMIALGSIMLRTWLPATGPAETQRRRELARSIGWYWHFMGFLWVVLFGMLAFWK